MKYLIVIPARGGSKGIPHKNIYPIAGKPLLEYTIESMACVKYEGDLVVSTDDAEISKVANRYEKVIVIKRPTDISVDTARTEDALIHAVKYMKDNFGKEYDAVVTLQATSPLRKSETIQNFLKAFENMQEKYDALLTLTEDRSDFWVQKEDGRFERRNPSAPRRRQERKPLYIENSAIYATKMEGLLKSHSVLGENANGYVIDAKESVDINEFIDIALAESLILEQRKLESERK